jgi:hypothetical protein
VSAASKIADLRSLIRTVEKPQERERYDFSLLPSGVPRGALIEVTGPGKTESVVSFLSENQALRIAWVEDQMTVYPTAILQRQVPLERVLFIEAGDEIVWAAMQVMRSGLFEAIILSLPRHLDERVLRRLQLESEKSQACVFLLSEKPHKAWPISLQIQVSRPALFSEGCEPLALDILKERA